MPQRRTAKKDLRKNKKRRLHNLKLKSEIKAAIKNLKKRLLEKDLKVRAEALRQVYKLLDKAAAKKLIHKNKVAHQKSRLTKLLNAAK